MTTNITAFPVENQCVVYLQDGTSYVIDPQQTHSLQLIDMGFCTISETNSTGDQPAGPPEWFVDAMIAFWTKFKETVTEPEINPL
jgi:hypothetical protein